METYFFIYRYCIRFFPANNITVQYCCLKKTQTRFPALWRNQSCLLWQTSRWADEEFVCNYPLLKVSFKSWKHWSDTSNQSVTFVKTLIQMNVWIYSYQQNYTNEYPNIFIQIFLTRTNVRISIRIENCMNIRIYSNIRLGFTL